MTAKGVLAARGVDRGAGSVSHAVEIAPAHGRPLAPGEIRLEVDRIDCDGYGMCAELLPELIVLDDWGYPIVHSLVPKHLVPLARRAVDVCPVLALKLRIGR
jgi:ferredoxin